MSRILKNLINNATGEFENKFIFYPSGKTEWDIEFLRGSDGVYYSNSNKEELLDLDNFVTEPEVLSKFISITFDAVIGCDYYLSYDNAVDIASQLHIQSITILNEPPPPMFKREDLYLKNERRPPFSSIICSSKDIARSWMLFDFDVYSSIDDLHGIIQDKIKKVFIK